MYHPSSSSILMSVLTFITPTLARGGREDEPRN
jgi:hypothetical protein